MVCSHQACGWWGPRKAWEGLAPQHRPSAEVQKEDLSIKAGSIFNYHRQGVWFVVAKDRFSGGIKREDLTEGVGSGS